MLSCWQGVKYANCIPQQMDETRRKKSFLGYDTKLHQKMNLQFEGFGESEVNYIRRWTFSSRALGRVKWTISEDEPSVRGLWGEWSELYQKMNLQFEGFGESEVNYIRRWTFSSRALGRVKWTISEDEPSVRGLWGEWSHPFVHSDSEWEYWKTNKPTNPKLNTNSKKFVN